MGIVNSTPKKSSLTKRVDTVGETRSGVQNAKHYSYEELRTATENFNRKNMIGQGGFGSVYLGTLNDDTLVAIKVLSTRSEQGEPEFLKEIEVLSGLNHVNLVKLYGSCTEGNNRILVYEYLEKNSLTRSLLGKRSNKLHFSWEIRSRICVGVAEGLAFLHDEVKIVHRDIKTCNVLLDKDFTPKISDFGLARLFPNSMTHLSTRVVGTPGYWAPEYVLTGRLTSKADIYSFGVLLLEIVSGRCNTDKKLPVAEQDLLKMAWKLYEKGRLHQLVDETLDRDSCANEACKYLKIGLLCAQERPIKRPTMSVVVQMLNGDVPVHEPRATFLGSCFCGN